MWAVESGLILRATPQDSRQEGRLVGSPACSPEEVTAPPAHSARCGLLSNCLELALLINAHLTPSLFHFLHLLPLLYLCVFNGRTKESLSTL